MKHTPLARRWRGRSSSPAILPIMKSSFSRCFISFELCRAAAFPLDTPQYARGCCATGLQPTVAGADAICFRALRELSRHATAFLLSIRGPPKYPIFAKFGQQNGARAHKRQATPIPLNAQLHRNAIRRISIMLSRPTRVMRWK